LFNICHPNYRDPDTDHSTIAPSNTKKKSNCFNCFNHAGICFKWFRLQCKTWNKTTTHQFVLTGTYLNSYDVLNYKMSSIIRWMTSTWFLLKNFKSKLSFDYQNEKPNENYLSTPLKKNFIGTQLDYNILLNYGCDIRTYICIVFLSIKTCAHMECYFVSKNEGIWCWSSVWTKCNSHNNITVR
jgi:hypothetical protein